MKRALTILAILASTMVLAPSAVRADPDWGFTFGFGGIGFHMGGHAGNRMGRPHPAWRPPVVVVRPAPVHVHHRVPVYSETWIPARYETVLVGYDRCGFPVWRSLCVSPGHYETVLAGYRCGGCDCRL